MMHLSRSQIKLTLFGPLHADVGLKRDVRAGKAKEIYKGAHMLRCSFILGSLAFGLAACGGAQLATIGPDGLPLAQVYRIGPQDADDIQFRMLDGLNALRGAAGAPSVQLNAQLNAAAATHSRDMSVQNRPWHFGSDGSSPIDRLRRVGYNGSLTGETISETYETEIETLGAWMLGPNTRAVLLDKSSTEMGIAWFQEGNGKIWWTLVLANANRRGIIAQENPVPLQ